MAYPKLYSHIYFLRNYIGLYSHNNYMGIPMYMGIPRYFLGSIYWYTPYVCHTYMCGTHIPYVFTRIINTYSYVCDVSIRMVSNLKNVPLYVLDNSVDTPGRRHRYDTIQYNTYIQYIQYIHTIHTIQHNSDHGHLWPQCELLWPQCELLWPQCELLWPQCELLWPQCELLWPQCDQNE